MYLPIKKSKATIREMIDVPRLICFCVLYGQQTRASMGYERETRGNLFEDLVSRFSHDPKKDANACPTQKMRAENLARTMEFQTSKEMQIIAQIYLYSHSQDRGTPFAGVQELYHCS